MVSEGKGVVGMSENTSNAGDGGEDNEETMAPNNGDRKGFEGERQPEEKSSVPVEERLFSQADVDRVVRDRLERERKKYEGFEDFKNTAERVDGLEAYNEKLEKKLAEYQRRETVERIATEHGVPTSVLRGHSEGEITEHAKALLEAFSQNAGVKAGGYAGVGVREAPPVDSAGKARVSEQQKFAQDLLRGR